MLARLLILLIGILTMPVICGVAVVPVNETVGDYRISFDAKDDRLYGLLFPLIEKAKF